MADSVGGDMIRGHIDSIILYSLLDGDKDTNQIRTEIENKAGGDFKLKQGTFYSALQRITKQGLVKDYRTTGADGVRRKFFQLTEKGKAHIEKGQTNWSQSQSVINKLLDTATGDLSEKSVPNPSIDYKIPSFDNEDDSVIEDFDTLSSNDDSEISVADSIIYSELEVIEQPQEVEPVSREDSDVMELLGVLTAEEKKPEEPEPEVTTYTYFETTQNSPPEEKVSAVEHVEPEKVEIIPDKTENFYDSHDDRSEYETIYNSDISTDSFVNAKTNEESNLDNEIDDELPDVLEIIATAESASVEPELPVREEQKVEEKASAITEPSKPNSEQSEKYKQLTVYDIPESKASTDSKNEDDDGVDDYLYADDIPDQREYKDVLSKIFKIAKENSEKHREEAEAASDSRIIDFPPRTEAETVEPDLSSADSEENSVIVDELDLNAHTDKHKTIEPDYAKAKKSGTFDYSDIIALSEAEGLRISTSDRTNKSELGRILVNKLNFHSSLLFFILIAMETLIVGLTMESVLDFGAMPYVIFGLLVFILPLINGIIYFISPKRAIAEIRSFKSSFETALIITLDAMIAILVLAVAFNLDFTSYPDLARIVLVPIIIAVNVPIYVIIRYSLLDKQTYYS